MMSKPKRRGAAKPSESASQSRQTRAVARTSGRGSTANVSGERVPSRAAPIRKRKIGSSSNGNEHQQSSKRARVSSGRAEPAPRVISNAASYHDDTDTSLASLTTMPDGDDGDDERVEVVQTKEVSRRTTRSMTIKAAIAVVCDAVFTTPELLEQILLHLPARQILVTQRVCHQFHNTITASPNLLEKIFSRTRYSLETWTFHGTEPRFWSQYTRARHFLTHLRRNISSSPSAFANRYLSTSSGWDYALFIPNAITPFFTQVPDDPKLFAQTSTITLRPDFNIVPIILAYLKAPKSRPIHSILDRPFTSPPCRSIGLSLTLTLGPTKILSTAHCHVKKGATLRHALEMAFWKKEHHVEVPEGDFFQDSQKYLHHSRGTMREIIMRLGNLYAGHKVEVQEVEITVDGVILPTEEEKGMGSVVGDDPC